MLLSEQRQEVLEVAKEMYSMGLVQGTGGNVSARDPKSGLIAITPTTLPYDTMTLEDIVIVDADGKVVEGKQKPSSETPMHTTIFKSRPDIGGIVHTHSPFATVASVIGPELPIVFTGIIAVGPIPVAKFQIPGTTELGTEVAGSLGRNGAGTLLQNHGVVTVGPSVKAAETVAIYVEEAAAVYVRARSCGEYVKVSEENVREWRRLFLH